MLVTAGREIFDFHSGAPQSPGLTVAMKVAYLLARTPKPLEPFDPGFSGSLHCGDRGIQIVVVTGQHDQIHIGARRGFHDGQGAQHIDTFFGDIDFWLYLRSCRAHTVGSAQDPVAQRLMDHAHRGVGLPPLLVRQIPLVPVEVELRLGQSSKYHYLDQFRGQWRHPVAYRDEATGESPWRDEAVCSGSAGDEVVAGAEVNVLVVDDNDGPQRCDGHRVTAPGAAGAKGVDGANRPCRRLSGRGQPFMPIDCGQTQQGRVRIFWASFSPVAGTIPVPLGQLRPGRHSRSAATRGLGCWGHSL
ncbi:hypothetical protein GCM10009632_05400 [Mycolicibacterium alvei]|uniref:Uncharacterized protein n=1 Tax=Mycolicibacterium alvei TaxID=67081 RepID=A0A6N4V2J7_9MYCO|nr:hypothetical protein MALV_56400 [Mycolicibacterium alvei]